MSEKRFSETERNCYYTSLVFDKKTQEELGTNKAVKLLNALYEENEQLKQKVDFYKYFQKDARELEKKNEQLFEEIKRLEKMIWKIQWRFQQEVGIEKAREHYREIDKEMKE